MSNVLNSLGRLFGKWADPFGSAFGDAVVKTGKEISSVPDSDSQFKDLMSVWLISVPWTYFEVIFMKPNRWNSPLRSLSLVDRAKPGQAPACFIVTQAFCLWNLKQLIQNKPEYSRYTFGAITTWIKENLSDARQIILALERLGESLSLTPDPSEWNFVHLSAVLEVLCGDEDTAASLVLGLRLDPRFALGLMITSTDIMTHAAGLPID
jgi:hypothetical protein